MRKMVDTVYCDFCAKSQHEVKNIVQGPRDIAICDECIALCVDVISKPQAQPQEQP